MINLNNQSTQDPVDIQIDLLKERLNKLHGGFGDHINAIIVEKANELLDSVLCQLQFDEHEYWLLIKAVNRTYKSETGLYHHPLTGELYDPCNKEMQRLIYRWWHGAYDKSQKINSNNVINPSTGEIN